ncbi:phage holin family protein [uncultured Sphingomonas sp.]|uniref:phage holin family protein n=1 Tax=uncultured Sphingomonas sp. TaxID=158754 RepID=UPI0035C9AA92
MSSDLPIDEGLPTLFKRLVDDGEGFARAEFELYRARLFARLGEARNAVVFAVVALLVALSAIMSGFVGLLLTLRELVGFGWATLIVVGGGLVLAGVLAALGYVQFRRATAVFEPKDKSA